MKAMVYTAAGDVDVLQIRELPRPVPKPNQVLIRVKACALNIADYERFRIKNGEIPFATRLVNRAMYVGKPVGSEVSGIVEQVGRKVTHVKVGDEVYGQTDCVASSGGLAEYAVLNRDDVCIKPHNLTFEEASTMSLSMRVALSAVKKAKIQPGSRVMVYGSSGGVGLYAVQLAKAYDAQVTGVCSTRNVDIAKRMGCDTVIDYLREDFTATNERYDAILGINGHNPMNAYRRLLKPSGIFVGVGDTRQGMDALIASMTSRQFTVVAGPISKERGYLQYAQQLAESGRLMPNIGRTYSVNDTRLAIQNILAGKEQGKTVIRTDFD